MLENFNAMQQYGKDNLEATMQAWGQLSKNMQTIAAETADYSKKSFAEGSAALEKMFAAKSLDKAIEIQNAYVKTTYEGLVAQAGRMGELYADLAKESCKPFEHLLAAARTTK
jgi:hypothetical protein